VKASNTSGYADHKSVLNKTPSVVIKRIIRSLLMTIFPARCMGCGHLFIPPPVDSGLDVPVGLRAISGNNHLSETDNRPIAGDPNSTSLDTNAQLSQWICSDCLPGWMPVTSPMCNMCGMPFKSRQGSDHLCGECIKNPKYFQSARTAAFYTPLTMALIHRFKYNRKIQLAKPLGVILASTFMRFCKIEDYNLIVPVPLHSKRFRQRGFNQAYLLAKEFYRQIQNTTQPALNVTVERGSLCRTLPTVSQTGLRRKSRLKNVKNAFRTINPSIINTQRILLIDDIYTTGATVNECAKVLLDGGASRIDVLTVARAV
jgi:ComF family protein